MSPRRRSPNETPEYQRWCAMKARCLNPTHKEYKNYGGRGITVCERWHDSFANFLADMGPRPSPSHSLDRINNEGNYEPTNCRWAEIKTQANNTRRNIFLLFRGKFKTITQWSDELGFPREVIRRRVERGWPIEDALTTPHDKWTARRKVNELRARGIPILKCNPPKLEDIASPLGLKSELQDEYFGDTDDSAGNVAWE